VCFFPTFFFNHVRANWPESNETEYLGAAGMPAARGLQRLVKKGSEKVAIQEGDGVVTPRHAAATVSLADKLRKFPSTAQALAHKHLRTFGKARPTCCAPDPVGAQGAKGAQGSDTRKVLKGADTGEDSDDDTSEEDRLRRGSGGGSRIGAITKRDLFAAIASRDTPSNVSEGKESEPAKKRRKSKN
jgi:hypothetical protein